MKQLLTRIRRFNRERDWEQFHSPKNLAMALMIEASEIAEHFQWLTEEESRDLPPETLAHIADEIGDVLIHLLNLADKLGIDLASAAGTKIEKNEIRYPAPLVRGRADKYTKYQSG